MTIAALYVETDGCYFGLSDVEPWDITRDARLYGGPYPAICHPPCQRWGRMWHGSTRKPHQFQKGADGGCFASALAAVERFGGVIEHPADSHAWAAFGINKPERGGGVALWWPRGYLHLDVLRLPGELRPSSRQADLAVCRRPDAGPVARVALGEGRSAPASCGAGQARLREGPPHRNDGHGRRQGQDADQERHAGRVPGRADRLGSQRATGKAGRMTSLSHHHLYPNLCRFQCVGLSPVAGVDVVLEAVCRITALKDKQFASVDGVAAPSVRAYHENSAVTLSGVLNHQGVGVCLGAGHGRHCALGGGAKQ